MGEVSSCGQAHPSVRGVVCRLEDGNHPEHLGGYEDDVTTWVNLSYRAPAGIGTRSERRIVLSVMARKLRKAQSNP